MTIKKTTAISVIKIVRFLLFELIIKTSPYPAINAGLIFVAESKIQTKY